MKVLAQDDKCQGNGCPQVLLKDEDTVIVQGYISTMTTPDGEQAVELPRAMLHKAAVADR